MPMLTAICIERPNGTKVYYPPEFYEYVKLAARELHNTYEIVTADRIIRGFLGVMDRSYLFPLTVSDEEIMELYELCLMSNEKG